MTALTIKVTKPQHTYIAKFFIFDEKKFPQKSFNPDVLSRAILRRLIYLQIHSFANSDSS